MLNVELKGDGGLLEPVLSEVRVDVASPAAPTGSVSHRTASVGEPACFGSLKSFSLDVFLSNSRPFAVALAVYFGFISSGSSLAFGFQFMLVDIRFSTLSPVTFLANFAVLQVGFYEFPKSKGFAVCFSVGSHNQLPVPLKVTFFNQRRPMILVHCPE